MALPANTQTTFTTIGNREDLAEIIYNISPMEVPFMTTAAKTGATNVTHEWQTDALADAATNRQLEGDDNVATTVTPTTRLNNKCQISTKGLSVSRTQRASNPAGRSDSFKYQALKRGQEIKRDMEFALVRNQASSAGAEGTARSSAGLESWLASNKTSAGTGTAQTTPGFAAGNVVAPTDSTILGTFLKADVDAVIQACWSAGGAPTVIMVGPRNRSIISGFAGISTLQTDANLNDDITIVGGADLYKSNFGVIKVVPNRFQRDETAFLIDFDFVAVAMLDEMSLTPLAKTGDADKAFMVTEFCLEMRNEAASGKVTDLIIT